MNRSVIIERLEQSFETFGVRSSSRGDHDLNPGMKPGIELREAAALREAEEEVGLERRHVRIIGRLDQYITRTGFSVTPVVGLVNPAYTVDPDDFEVAEVFEVPLAFLLDAANHRRDSRVYKGLKREFYAMPYNDYYIWGATAGMIRNLYDVLIGEVE